MLLPTAVRPCSLGVRSSLSCPTLVNTRAPSPLSLSRAASSPLPSAFDQEPFDIIHVRNPTTSTHNTAATAFRASALAAYPYHRHCDRRIHWYESCGVRARKSLGLFTGRWDTRNRPQRSTKTFTVAVGKRPQYTPGNCWTTAIVTSSIRRDRSVGYFQPHNRPRRSTCARSYISGGLPMVTTRLQGPAEGLSVETRSHKTSDDVHTPTLISPPGTKTPPTAPGKRTTSAGRSSHGAQRHGSEPVDADALSKALHQFEEAGRRERTPGDSPKRKRQRVYTDR